VYGTRLTLKAMLASLESSITRQALLHPDVKESGISRNSPKIAKKEGRFSNYSIQNV
jgi:hypothetical protein